jgi:putative transposase
MRQEDVYSLEERLKAAELYVKYGGGSAPVRRELGYPSKRPLKLWVREYQTLVP